MRGGIPPIVDRLIAIVALVVLSPVLALAGFAVRATSPGPMVHRAQRVGLNGQLFTLLKFRSMRVGGAGPAITTAGDARITPVGRVLRLTKLDELPQLINVARGEMAIVGPRPEDPRYVELYTREQRRLLSVRPGITSPASVRYRHEEAMLAASDDPDRAYVETVLPAKLAIDLAWLDNRSVFNDLKVIAETLAATIKTKRP